MNVKHTLDIVQSLLSKSEITLVEPDQLEVLEIPEDELPSEEVDASNWDPFADADKISALAQSLEHQRKSEIQA